MSQLLPCKEFDYDRLANIYLFKVNNRNSRQKSEICSKLTINPPEGCHSGFFDVNFQSI